MAEIVNAHTLTAGSTVSAGRSTYLSTTVCLQLSKNAYLEDLIESFILYLFNIGCHEWTVSSDFDLKIQYKIKYKIRIGYCYDSILSYQPCSRYWRRSFRSS
jgi:hypothetical protein